MLKEKQGFTFSLDFSVDPNKAYNQTVLFVSRYVFSKFQNTYLILLAVSLINTFWNNGIFHRV